MLDLFLSAVILGWTFLAAQAATSQVTGLFGMVHASLEQLLAQMS